MYIMGIMKLDSSHTDSFVERLKYVNSVHYKHDVEKTCVYDRTEAELS